MTTFLLIVLIIQLTILIFQIGWVNRSLEDIDKSSANGNHYLSDIKLFMSESKREFDLKRFKSRSDNMAQYLLNIDRNIEDMKKRAEKKFDM